MFHERLKKHELRFIVKNVHTVESSLNWYFMKYSKRKILQCILPLNVSHQ